MRAGRRNIKYDTNYNRFFDEYKNETIIQNENGNVHDTIKSIVFVNRNYAYQAKAISKKLKGNTKLQTAKNIYNFCYSYFQYKEDAPGTDTVRTPNRAWADRLDGIDCDCYSALISCILSNYGWEHIIRMSANYKASRYNHVYIILLDNQGNEICIDPVVDRFNKEASYLHKKDEKMEVSVLNGLDNPQRPLSSGSINIIQWIVQNELRSQSRIVRAIAVYAKQNGLQTHYIENILANQMYAADIAGWKHLAKSRIVVKRSKRNFSIRSSNVLVFVGLQNSNRGLFVSLMHDANFLELWLENTLNLPLATQIATGINEFSKNKEKLNSIIPFKKIVRYTKAIKPQSYTCCSCHTEHTKSIIYNQDAASNLLQLSIVINSAPKGKLIKTVGQMYKPDGSLESNRLHDKLNNTAPLKPLINQVKHNRALNGGLNGWGTIIGGLVGTIFGGPAGAAAGGAIGTSVDTLLGGKGGSSGGSNDKPTFLMNEVYVLPNGKPFNPRTENASSPNFTQSIKDLQSKPYGATIVAKYNEITTQKGGINPTQNEYNVFIAPLVAEGEKQYQAELLRQKKRRNIITYSLISTGVLAAAGGGYYFYSKRK